MSVSHQNRAPRTYGNIKRLQSLIYLQHLVEGRAQILLLHYHQVQLGHGFVVAEVVNDVSKVVTLI